MPYFMCRNTPNSPADRFYQVLGRGCGLKIQGKLSLLHIRKVINFTFTCRQRIGISARDASILQH
jgi:hypothetical protein